MDEFLSAIAQSLSQVGVEAEARGRCLVVMGCEFRCYEGRGQTLHFLDRRYTRTRTRPYDVESALRAVVSELPGALRTKERHDNFAAMCDALHRAFPSTIAKEKDSVKLSESLRISVQASKYELKLSVRDLTMLQWLSDFILEKS